MRKLRPKARAQGSPDAGVLATGLCFPPHPVQAPMAGPLEVPLISAVLLAATVCLVPSSTGGHPCSVTSAIAADPGVGTIVTQCPAGVCTMVSGSPGTPQSEGGGLRGGQLPGGLERLRLCFYFPLFCSLDSSFAATRGLPSAGSHEPQGVGEATPSSRDVLRREELAPSRAWAPGPSRPSGSPSGLGCQRV